MLDLSDVSNQAILATVDKYEGVLAGTHTPNWDCSGCAICVETYDCEDCCLCEDGWCNGGDVHSSKLYPGLPGYHAHVEEFLGLVHAEKTRRGI